MTVKKGDIVFVSQPHHSTPVPGVVLSIVPATSSGLPQAQIHIISSSDPYQSSIFGHRDYADESGYREAGESEVIELRPKKISNADASEELSEGGDAEPSIQGDGSGLVPETEGSSEESEQDGEGESEEEPEELRDEGPFDVEPDEDDDEREEDESAEEVSSAKQDGKPLSATGRKRGKGRKR